jgi:hypothetical protein
MTFRQRVFARLALTFAAAITLTGLALGMTAEAQDATRTPETETPTAMPIVFSGRGQTTLMDAETGEVTPWDECPGDSAARLSSDGAWLAERGLNGQVVLCEIASRAVFTVGETIDSLEFASFPAWSPDASAVAWTLTVDGAQTLYVYDLAAEETTVLAEGLPAPDLLPQVLWGKSGIIVANDSPQDSMRWAALFTPDGKLINDELANNEYMTRYALVTDENGREYLERAVVWSDVVDLETFEVLLPGYIRLVSLYAPDGLSIIMNPDPAGVYVNLPDGESFTINSFGDNFGDFTPHFISQPLNLAISPDGTAFVVWSVGKGLWRHGEMEPMPGNIHSGDSVGVLWGPTGYRLQSDELMSGAG